MPEGLRKMSKRDAGKSDWKESVLHTQGQQPDELIVADSSQHRQVWQRHTVTQP